MINYNNAPLETTIEVRELFENPERKFELVLLAGEKGLNRKIKDPHIQKLGLVLAGEFHYLDPHRIQIFGKKEITYLTSLKKEVQVEILEAMGKRNPSCFILSRGMPPPDLLVEACNRHDIPLFSSPLKTSQLIDHLNQFLKDRMAPTTTVHGVLLDVFGVGVLILGKSGIGKSECALDLIIRGHRLVSDDVVKIIQTEPTTLFGTSFNLIQNLMEIRGLGIINIRDLFGVEAIRKRKKIDLIVELVDWLSIEKPERLGLDQNTIKLLDVEMPFIQIPVTPGRNLTTIIEVAARNHILRASGTHTPQELEENLLKKMREENSG
ncbi:MAG: HPr(Ser) kinase/phosphatase [Deltaproteobacteria bacterium]|nr:HPr(Ser) kinase/phosphatase [Deltaproteobacteria bacterium]